MKNFLWTFQKLFRPTDTAFDMLKANSIDKAVAYPLIYHKFHIQIGFSMRIAYPVCFINRFLAADGAKDRDSAKFINMVIHGLHADGTHIRDKKAGVERA